MNQLTPQQQAVATALGFESTDLLSELEESIPQGVPNDTGHRRRVADLVEEAAEEEQVDSLDALLAESVAEVEAKAQYISDRKAAAKGYAGLSKEEVEFCNSRMRAFELARVWKADKAISVWVRSTCKNCRAVQTIFSRLMEHHKHRENRSASRWIVVTTTRFGTPAVISEQVVPMCVNCASGLGIYPWNDAPNFDKVVINGQG